MSDRLTVLVAEDYSDFRRGLLKLLEPLGLNCIAVKNGQLAIDVLEDPDQEVHLVITDLDMPVKIGWDVIEAARKHRGEALPIILQTGEATYPYVVRKASELGVPLIHKPDVPTNLVPAVRIALGLPVDEVADKERRS